MGDNQESGYKYISIYIPEWVLDKNYSEPDYKLAHLISQDVIFINNGHWDKNWPKDHVSIHVNCNDVFAWGVADAEDITHSDIGELYEMWKKDPIYGPAAWCIKKRKIMPQKPVADDIRKLGIWDLEELIKTT